MKINFLTNLKFNLLLKIIFYLMIDYINKQLFLLFEMTNSTIKNKEINYLHRTKI